MQTPDTYNELEKQLSHPEGETGIKVAQNMFQSNAAMINHAIKALKIQNEQSILELGHGNCQHLPDILNQANHCQYVGLEVSKTMQAEAHRINANLISNASVAFQTYDGSKIPFSKESFDWILSVNTIYFWKKPQLLLSEIYRVLKPQGFVVLSFVKKDFMRQLPFVKQRFKLYNLIDLKKLIKPTDFLIHESQDITENAISKTGEKVEREFLTVILKKSSYINVAVSLAFF